MLNHRWFDKYYEHTVIYTVITNRYKLITIGNKDYVLKIWPQNIIYYDLINQIYYIIH